MRGYYIGDLEITKREILASISIVAVLLLIGVLISSKISESQMDRNETYNKAVKIESQELFQYGMDTNVGNAFVYGELVAVDTVTYPEIGGEYMYVEKVKEKYTKHTRQVSHTKTVNGKSQTYYTTETYWTWDRVGSEDIRCNEISFCNIAFRSNKFNIPSATYIDMIKESSHIRYKYYGVSTSHTGTIFTDLRDNTISDSTPFYENRSIVETVDYLESSGGVVLFWVLWIIVIVICVFAFFYAENNWLE